MHFRNSLFIFMLLIDPSFGVTPELPMLLDSTTTDPPDTTPQPAPENTTPTPPPEDCAGAIEQCQDDYADSGQTRSDLLVLRQCVANATCDGNDDDTALRDRALFVVNSNDFHWIPEDDPGESNNVQAMSSSILSIVMTLVAMLKLTILYRPCF